MYRLSVPSSITSKRNARKKFNDALSNSDATKEQQKDLFKLFHKVLDEYSRR